MIDKDKLYKIREVVTVTGLSVGTLRNRIKQGRLKIATAPNEDIRIWGSEITKMLESR